MKVTGVDTFVVNTGFTPRRPWLFCAVRTDAGLTGYGEFGGNGITRGLVGLVADLGEHLSTFQSLNLCASVSNVKIMESDPDAVPIRDELFTALPEIEAGHMRIPAAPGGGTDLNESVARRHAWSG